MENENPILIGMSTITGTIILYMSYSMNNPLLIGVALIICGIGFGGVIWNKVEEWQRDKFLRRRPHRSLRREFRGTQMGDIINMPDLPVTAEPGKGFGEGIYGDPKDKEL